MPRMVMKHAALTASLLLASSCAAGPAHAQAAAGAIRLADDTRVCVAGEVSSDLGFESLPRYGDSFAGALAYEMERLEAIRTGRPYPPGSDEQRFLPAMGFPACAAPAAIHIRLRYEPNRNGELFALRYTISQAGVTRSGQFERDIPREIREHRFVPLNSLESSLPGLIADDIRARAPHFLQMLSATAKE
jgi:hypothetical protein